ncbi:MAG TPA: hypothetical protein VFT95_21650, partial [Micromonosporaceae bacterium]|nr:hypothetical protein [Micromonosporaceae bacterium]
MNGRVAGLRNWAVSLAATAVSAYALDACAAAAGVSLVASGLLGSLDQPWATAFLVVTYGAWGLGLRTNMRANGLLLAATGISTNALSKAAYDVTRRRTSNPRAPRLAAAVGYIGTEVALEVPYYAAAFAAAAFTDAVTSEEAVVFLGGANLGA